MASSEEGRHREEIEKRSWFEWEVIGGNYRESSGRTLRNRATHPPLKTKKKLMQTVGKQKNTYGIAP